MADPRDVKEEKRQDGAFRCNGAHLHLQIAGPIPSWLSAILQGGFGVKVPGGLSVNDLLCRELGLDPEYVQQRVTTIFVNGTCVDDVKGSMLGPGSTLALSSSMPGLAGASLRRQSPYGALRGPVTYDPQRARGRSTEGTIRVKLFNVLIQELGPLFLERGVVLGRADSARVLEACDGIYLTVNMSA
jgi:hypothetical protein